MEQFVKTTSSFHRRVFWLLDGSDAKLTGMLCGALCNQFCSLNGMLNGNKLDNGSKLYI